MKESNNLTTNTYWDRCYKGEKNTGQRIDIFSEMPSSELNVYFRKNLPKDKKFKFLEIGCAPGRWMHYFYSNFNYCVEGIEYTPNGAKLTRSNLSTLGVDNVIYEQDLFNNSLNKNSYDLVFSAGFIEHFNDPSLVIEKHLGLLKKGGYLVLEVPNFRGFNGFFQKITDKSLLEIHNLNIMNLDFFKNIAEKHDLEIVDISYVGKINFGLFLGNKFLIYIGQVIQFFINKLYFILGKRIFISDNKFFSPYIVAVYVKK